ncbi:hypothetical protein N836_36340 [Leptolyngbya sp. Heron Island J]|nr:hypothetical protein [Leptolyngbya sp. Heron Island J]ESA37639.1 hypothetical protein N836_36340 [Leptolyngbya sp. Heron Island J]
MLPQQQLHLHPYFLDYDYAAQADHSLVGNFLSCIWILLTTRAAQ